MAKMMKPEVEAVRFGEVDVIATSGMTGGQKYAAFSDEFKQPGSYFIEDDNYGWVVFDGSNTSTANGKEYDNLYNGGNSYYYAWYDNDNWQTDNLPLSHYENAFPIGGGVSWNKDGQ